MKGRRGPIVASSFLLFLSWTTAIHGQAFPARPITLIVPFIAGGSTDVTFRSLASATQRHLGQTIIIENRPGASATLAPAQIATTTKPDGYTLTQMLDTVLRAPFVSKVTYDPVTDFTYVISVTGYTYGVVVRADAPWQTFQEFLADAERSPGKFTYATSGVYSSPQLTMERIAKQRGLKLTPVPFKGNADQINALLGGHIHSIVSSTAWAPQVKAGQFRLLVTFGATRTRTWPHVPTLKDSGIDMVVDSPYGIAGPAGMDPHVVKVLHDAFKSGMEEPAFSATLAQLDQDPFYLSSSEYRDFAMKQVEEAKRLVQELGIKQQ
jgi:tripartite-type tricarboxylate transporter receptor subunit TctC